MTSAFIYQAESSIEGKIYKRKYFGVPSGKKVKTDEREKTAVSANLVSCAVSNGLNNLLWTIIQTHTWVTALA